MKRAFGSDINPHSNLNGRGKNHRSAVVIVIITVIFFLLFIITSLLQNPSKTIDTTSGVTQDELFDFTQIRDVHIQFKDSSWQKMQPFGGPYGVNGVGVGWLDISIIMGSTFWNVGDLNRDMKFSRTEFLGLGEKWFQEWTMGKDTALNFNTLDSGFAYQGWDLRTPNGRNGVGQLLGILTPEVKAELQVEDMNFPTVSIRYKGNGTLMDAVGTLKRSLKIDLNDGFQTRNFAGVNKLTLHNLLTDAGYMNDILAYRLFRDAKVPSPRTSYARVYFTVPDTLDHHYIGLYLLVENVDNNFAQHWYGTKKGAIFKPVAPKLFEYMGDDWSKYIQTFDPKTALSIQETSRIIEVCKFVTNSTDEEFSDRLGHYFDLDNLARYLALNVLICDLDGILGPNQNMYLYLHPKTFQISFIPWDHDHSFGQMRGTQEERENLSLEQPWMIRNFFLERLWKDEQFKLLYYQYLQEFNDTLFQPQRIRKQIDELVKIIRPAIKDESPEKLRNFDIAVGLSEKPKEVVEVSAKTDGPPEPPPAEPTWEYVKARHKSVADQLMGKSKGMTIKGGFMVGLYGNLYMSKMDENKDNILTHTEFINSFDKWFKAWSTPEGFITFESMRDGINRDISFFGPDPKKIQKADSTKTEKSKPDSTDQSDNK